MVLKNKSYIPKYQREYSKEYYENNKEKCLADIRKWQDENKDKIKKHRKKSEERRREKVEEWKDNGCKKSEEPSFLKTRRMYVEKNRDRINKRRREANKIKFAADPDFWKKSGKKNKKKQNARAIAQRTELLTYCELCNSEDKLERHHNRGYDYPNDFLTLCNGCHFIVHDIILKDK